LASRTIANAVTDRWESDELIEKGVIAVLFIALQLGSFEVKVEARLGVCKRRSDLKRSGGS
jgi:hypothetical protein